MPVTKLSSAVLGSTFLQNVGRLFRLEPGATAGTTAATGTAAGTTAAAGQAAAGTPAATATQAAAAGTQQAIGATPNVHTQSQFNLTPEQVQAVIAPMLTAVRDQVTQQLAPVQQQLAATQQQFQALAAPRTQASTLFGGGAPGVRTGESPLTSRGFSYHRAIGFRQGFYREDDCKVELEIHRRLHASYVEQGAFTPEGRNSILVPLGSQMLTGVDPTMAAEIHQCIVAGVAGADVGAIRNITQSAYADNPFAMRQALSQFDDTGLGVFLGPTQRGELIELIRAMEFFSRVGATQLTLPPNGRLQFDKQTGATTAYWVGEVPSDKSTPTITASAPTTGYLTLLAKKLAVLVKLPNELLRFASADLEAFIRADMARTMALEADSSMLGAIGSTNRIKGLVTYAGVQSHTASTVATDGNQFEPRDVGRMIAKLEDANYDSDEAVFGMRPLMWENLCERRADAVETGDQAGPYLFVDQASVTAGRPSTLRGKRVVKSTQISNARVKNSGTDLTYILLGLFRHWMIGRVGVMEFATSTQGDTAFQTDQTWVRAIQHLDAGPRYENAFVLCDQIDMDLP